MIDTWSSTYTIFFLTSCLLIGIGVGFLLRSIGNIGRINKAVEEFKKEAEAEKLEISRDLSKQLVQVKESIIKTVEAYSSVAKTIQERLPIPPEFEALYSHNSDALRLEVTQVADEKRSNDSESRCNEKNTDLNNNKSVVEDGSSNANMDILLSGLSEAPPLATEGVVETQRELPVG